MDASGVSRINREVSLILDNLCDELKPQMPSFEVPHIDLIKGTATYRRKGDALSIRLKKINETDLNAILNFIKNTLS